MKQKCAKKAFELIEDNMTIGLGGGATVALLIQELERQHKKITAVTPSADTMELCFQHQIPVLPLEMAAQIDLAFDGCDELDMELNALKSCGGIHTREKIVAAMAREYILLADETKLGDTLRFHVPITVEAIPAARAYVKARLTGMGAAVKERRGDKKAGLVVSDDGNYLLEAAFPGLQALPSGSAPQPEFQEAMQKTPQDLQKLSQTLDGIPGIVGHSLFYGLASQAIVARQNRIDILKRAKTPMQR